MRPNEPNLADAFERASKSLAALARHEAAARRVFDKALSNLWKLQAPRRRDDVARAAQSELEGFIDAYVNAPMPGTIRRPEPNRDRHGAAAPSDNSNPIGARPAAFLPSPRDASSGSNVRDRIERR
ncbi:MAG TPA: hypothetical protein VN428_06210 [Bryobacteraceae bacterium]|nr:hypothetical protein [Bryobacteraceae bacterium]